MPRRSGPNSRLDRVCRRGLAAAAVLVCLVGPSCGGASQESLQSIEDRRSVDSVVLREALRSDDPARRHRAVVAMGRVQAADHVEMLAEAAADPDSEVRFAALFALGQLGLAEGLLPPPPAVRACQSRLASEDPPEVALAVEALGKLAAAGSAETLTPYLKHRSAAVRAETAHALFRLRFAPVLRRTAEAPPPLPDASLAALERALGDPDAAVRRMAAHAFSRYPDGTPVDALVVALADEDRWTRVWAARGLGRAGDPAGIPPLVGLLDEGDEQVRIEAVLALVRLEAFSSLPDTLATDPSFAIRAAFATAVGPRSPAKALGLLGDESLTVRAAAIEALAATQGIESLDAAFAEEAWTIRAAAVRGAGSLGEAGLPLIARALADGDTRIVTAGLEALDRVGGQDDRIAAHLSVDDLAIRGTAVGLLAGSADPRRLAWMVEAYDASPGAGWVEVRESVLDVVAEYERGEQDGDEYAGVEALLRRAAHADAASSVRQRAVRILAGRGVEVPGASVSLEPSPWIGSDLAREARVALVTNRGTIEIRTLPQEAPIHVASFLSRVREGFYDGLIWHRVVPNFVIQGGDPRGDGWGSGGVVLRDEIDRRRFVRGMVGMPKAGKDTGGCQIFITHMPTPHLDGNYTIYGVVESGLDVVDRIEVGDRIESATVLD